MDLIRRPMDMPTQLMTAPALRGFDPEKRIYSGGELFVEGIRSTSNWPAWNPANWDITKDIMQIPYDEDFSAAERLAERPDLLPYADQTYSMRNEAEYDEWVTRIDTNRKREQILADGGLPALMGEFVGMLGSPEVAPFLIWNPLAAGRGMVSTMLRVSGQAALEASIYEVGRHRLDPERTMRESAMNTAIGGLMGFTFAGSILGLQKGGQALMRKAYHAELAHMKKEIVEDGGIHTIRSVDELTPEEIKAQQMTAREMEGLSADEIQKMRESGVSIAAVAENRGDTVLLGGDVNSATTRQQTLAGEAPRWMPWLKSGQITPLRTLWAARNPQVVKLLNDLWGHDLQVGYNSQPVYKMTEAAPGRPAERVLDADGNPIQIGTEHIAKSVALSRTVDRKSMELFVQGHEALVTNFMKSLGKADSNFNIAQLKPANRRAYDRFNEDVRWAMSHGDVAKAGTVNADLVTETAQAIRSKVYNPVLKIAKEAGLLEDDAVKFAESFLNRRYNRRAIRENQEVFREMLFDGFVEDSMQSMMRATEGRYAEKIRWRSEAIGERPDKLLDRQEKLVDRLGRLERELQENPVNERAAEIGAEQESIRGEIAVVEDILKTGDSTNTRQLNEIRKRQTAIEDAIAANKREQKAFDTQLKKLRDGKSKLKTAKGRANRQAKINEVKAQKEAAQAEHMANREKLAKERDVWRERFSTRRAGMRDKNKAARQELAKLRKERSRLFNRAGVVRKKGKIQEVERNIKSVMKKLDGDDPTVVRLEEEIETLTAEMKALDVEDYRDRVMEDDFYIRDQVKDTYDRIMDGEIGTDFFRKGTGASSLKERKVPISDTLLLEGGFLETDMIEQMKSYVNATLRPAMMKNAGFDVNLETEIRIMKDGYRRMMDDAVEAGDIELARSLEDEQRMAIAAHELVLDRFYGRANLPGNSAQEQISNIGQILRNIQVLTKMGGVLVSSMADVARVALAAGYMRQVGGQGSSLVTAMKTAKLNKQAFKMAGIAHESASMVRLSKWMDIADPNQTSHLVGEGMERMTQLTQKGAQLLMRATGLAEWTDYMKLLAASSTQNQILLQVRNYSKLDANAKSILAEIGVDQPMVDRVMKEIKAGNIQFEADDITASMNFDQWSDPVMAETMKDILFRQSERLLVTPRETDLPPFMDTETGRLVLQFKSFSLAAHNQITLPLLQRVRHQGDIRAISGIAWMLVAGTFTEAMKLASQGRLEELERYKAADWTLAAMDRSGVIPAIMMGFNHIDLMSGNAMTGMMGAMPASRYSDRAVLGIFGPTAGMLSDVTRLTSSLAAATDGDPNTAGWDERDGRTLRRIMPFNNLAWTHWLARQAEQYFTEDLEQVPRR